VITFKSMQFTADDLQAVAHALANMNRKRVAA
jgi:hypothetical protein